MPNYREIKVSSVHQYIKIINTEKTDAKNAGNNVDFLFRGQPEDSPLIPKLARLKLRGEIINIERLILDEFKRTCIPLSEFQPQDEWDLLALAQHHGLPTRLLDWTYSALIALWFAVREVPKDNNKIAVVWLFIPNLEDYRSDIEEFGPLSNKITKIFRPKIISRRISAQSAVFTVHKIIDGGRVVKFENHKNYSTKLLKIMIESKHFPAMRNELNTLGVNSASVFPDLVGLCEHLQWRYSYKNDEIIKKIKK